MKYSVLQVLPALEVGGVERGTVDLANKLVKEDFLSFIVSAGGRLEQELTSNGSAHITMPIGYKTPWTFLYIKKLSEFIKKNNINILHARSRLPAWIAYLAIKRLPEQYRPFFVTTVHGPYSVNFYSKIMVRGQRIIAVSEFIKDYIKANYPDINHSNITVIHRGIDPEKYYAEYKPDISWKQNWFSTHPRLIGKKIITLPGRLTRWKGQLDFVEIIRLLVEKKLPIHGVIAGGTDKKSNAFVDEINDRIQQNNLQNSITLIGQRNDLQDVMAISDMVVSLAKTPEAFGRTALEALSLGVPVVAYDHGGASEVLNALFPAGLVPESNINDTVEKITGLLTQQHRPATHNPFTLDAMTSKTIKLYRESLNL